MKHVLVATVALALLVPAAAEASPVLPPTVTSSFTPPLVGVGDTTALGITITNPNSSATLSSIGFTDTLPAGVTIDTPNGESGTCGSAGVVTANSGSSTFSLTGGSLKGGANCVVSVAVTASAAETVQNDTGPVSSSAGSSATGDTETLTVLQAPVVTVATPKNNARYTYRETVRANYSCGQTAYALGITSCSASDDLDNTINDGGTLVTNVPGQHSLTVIGTSIDGDATFTTVNYTVLPNNVFTIVRAKLAGGKLSFVLDLPGAGKVSAVALSGGSKVASAQLTTRSERALHVRLSVGSASPVRLRVTYTPKGGVARTAQTKPIA